MICTMSAEQLSDGKGLFFTMRVYGYFEHDFIIMNQLDFRIAKK